MSTQSNTAPQLDELLDHASWLRSLARRLVVDAADVEDLLQETWLTALRRPPTERSNLRGWLGTVATNLARQRWRRSGRVEAGLEAEPQVALDPAELTAEVELGRDLAARVLELDEPYRTTVLLRYWRGLNATEIAQREGVAASTVRWRLSEALEQLRTGLDDTNDGDRRAWLSALAPFAVEWRSAAVTSSGASLVGTAAGVLLQAWLWAVMGAVIVVFGMGALSMLGGTRSGSAVTQDLTDYRFPTELATLGAIEVTVDERTAVLTEDPTVPVQIETATDGVAVEQGAHVVLQVVDQDGLPVPEARAELFGSRHVVAADGNGRIDFVVRPEQLEKSRRALSSDLVSIVVGAPEHELGVVEGRLVPGGEHDFGVVVLGPGGSVGGVVMDEAGLAIEGAFVGVVSPTLGPDGEVDSVRGFGPHVDRYRFVTTDASGRFELHGVPASPCRVAAAKPDWVGGSSPILSPSFDASGTPSGFDGEPLELVMRRDPNRRSILGRIVDGEGVGVAYARVDYEGGSLFVQSRGLTTSDGSGRFAIDVESGGQFDLTVRSNGHDFGAVRREGVRPSTSVYQFVVETAQPWTLTVLSSDGGRLPNARIHSDAISLLDPVDASDVSDDDSTHRLLAPNFPFEITISAEHHEELVLSDLQGTNEGRSLEVVLESLPGIRGRVLDPSGRPLPDASVVAVEAWDGYARIDGFPARVMDSPVRGSSTSTDPDGRFRYTERRRASLYVRVEAEGFAPFEVGPIDHRPEVGLDLGELRMGLGGALEGSVFDVDGEPVPGAVVAVNRGDGAPRTVRTDSDGRYRFERLTPGPWQVRRRDAEFDSLGAYSTRHLPLPMGRGLDADVVVTEGGITSFDLAPENDGLSLLTGRVLVDGRPAVGWSVRLTPEPSVDLLSVAGLQGVAAPAGLDDPWRTAVGRDGRFELTVGNRGPARVVVQSDAGYIVWRDVVLADQELEIELDLTQSFVEVTGAAPDLRSPVMTLLRVELGEWTAARDLTPDLDGTSASVALPHGSVDVVELAIDPSNPEGAEAVTVERFEHASGGGARVDLED